MGVLTSGTSKATGVADKLHLKLKSSLLVKLWIFGALPILCIMVLEKIYPSDNFLNESVKESFIEWK